MKKCFLVLLLVSCVLLFNSCYAYLKAEKMIYQGSVAKGNPSVTLTEDSTKTEYAVE